MQLNKTILSMEKLDAQYLVLVERLKPLKLLEGQVFVVPFHYLENSDNLNDCNFASFFGNENPEFLGLAGGLSAYSNDECIRMYSLQQGQSEEKTITIIRSRQHHQQ